MTSSTPIIKDTRMYQQQPQQWQPPRPPVPRRKQPDPRTPWRIGAGVVGFIVLSLIVYVVKGPPSPKPVAAPAMPSRTASAVASTTSDKQSPKASPRSAVTVGGDCPPGPDLLVWMKSPGAPAAAQALGSYDSADCRRVHRESAAHFTERTSPTGPGFCTQAAYASDNPGYEERWLNGPDALTVVPPKLKRVIMSVGGGC